MGYKIKEIVLSDEVFSRYEVVSDAVGEEQAIKKLRNLSKINIFIGANNSGKSRFLRQLFANQFSFVPSDFNLSQFDNIILNCQKQLQHLFDIHNVDEYGGIRSDSVSVNPLTYININSEFARPFLESVTRLAGAQKNSGYSSIPGAHVNLDTRQFAASLRDIGNTARTELANYYSNLTPELTYSFEKTYIPILRGLRPYSTHDGQDQYLQKTLDDYFKNLGVASKITTGLLVNNTIRDKLLGNLQDRRQVANFQEFLGKTFFNNQSVALIPSLDKNFLTVKIGDEEEKPIYELGDGIQMLIILTFPLFMNQGENLLVFIEEPELFLHPGLQRVFIETLLDPRFDSFQYFIATHSNHFLDITLDVDSISVYTFKKFFKDENGDEKPAYFQIENVNNEDTNVLDLIGVKNSSVFLSNCTIWVEGITDRYYLRKYLEVYQKSLGEGSPKFREDTHYSFVEYSGGNITHWSFLGDEEAEEIHQPITVERICRRIFLVSDRDQGKEKRHEKLKERLGENYYCLECREIENLLSLNVLLKVIAEYEGVGSSELKFKPNNKYQNALLGNFIEKNLLDKKRKGSYASESGTVSDKVNFCKKAIQHIENPEDLSEEARRLCEKIYEFIKANNALNL